MQNVAAFLPMKTMNLAFLLCLFTSAAAFSAPAATTSRLFASHFSKAKKNELVLTYLETNGFLMSVDGVTILIDPILEGPLDFGIPDFYTGKKKVLPSAGLCDLLPPVDCILITQGLDDHAHLRTLTKLASMVDYDNVPIVAPPSARGALERSGMLRKSNVRFLKHGERTTVQPLNKTSSAGVSIRATTGALVGPPWQKPENGYILRSNGPSVYIEPHVEFRRIELSKEAPVDVVITPIVGQSLPAFALVHGPQDTVRLVKTLRPKLIVPMRNGDLEIEGILSKLVTTVGTESEFRERLRNSAFTTTTEILDLVPGEDQIIKV
jgi:L-ascorbate metabolism protein UlaG (beta-lactamase superfamily)